MNNIKITITDDENEVFELITHRDNNVWAWVHIFKTILYWLTFCPETINEALNEEIEEWKHTGKN